MTANKGQNRVEELENYLGSSWNRVIYHRLTRGDRVGLFEPLEFINILRGLYSYAIVSKHKPSVLVERLNQIDLTDGQKSFLLHYLDILFFEDSIRNAIERQIHRESSMEDTLGMSYQVEILAEWAKLQTPVDDLYGYRDSGDRGYGYRDSLLSVVRSEYVHRRPGGKDDLARDVMDMAVKQRLRVAMQDRYNFNRVRQHLDTLPDNETKIICLIEIKTEYLQVGATSDPKSEGFDRKCELEIKKLRGLIKITRPGKLITSTQNDQASDKKAIVPQKGWSEDEYLTRARPAAKAIGRNGDNLSDERMADMMLCSRNTATKYRKRYANTYAKAIRAAHKAGLREYANRRSAPT